MEPTSPEAQAELARKHKATATTVGGLLVSIILLSVVAFLIRSRLPQRPNPPLDMAVRIVILIFGLGSIAWRRTKFSTMRLQDIAGVEGVSGLIRTLEKTTLQLAVIGDSIAVVGFIATILTGNDLYTYWASLIALVVLIYCYPTRTSWLKRVYRFTERQPDASATVE